MVGKVTGWRQVFKSKDFTAQYYFYELKMPAVKGYGVNCTLNKNRTAK